MLKGPLYNIGTAAKALGKEKNRKLIRALIRGKRIPHQCVGNDTIIDQEGFDQLAEAVKEWDERPTLRKLSAAS